METRDAKGSSPEEHPAREYLLSAVRYGIDRSYVYKARVHRVRPGSVDPPLEILRGQLLAALDGGRVTITVSVGQGHTKPAQGRLQVVWVEGEKYLRTDARNLPGDHLPGVAEF